MLNFVKAMFGGPTPSGPPEVLTEFKPGMAEPLDESIGVENSVWKLRVDGKKSIPLFRFSVPEGTESCRLDYQMRVRTELQSGFVYLEMWCNLPGLGKYFSKGLNDKIRGSTDWSVHDVPFMLKKGQQPDELDVNLFADGVGTVTIKEITVLKTPLA